MYQVLRRWRRQTQFPLTLIELVYSGLGGLGRHSGHYLSSAVLSLKKNAPCERYVKLSPIRNSVLINWKRLKAIYALSPPLTDRGREASSRYMIFYIHKICFGAERG